MTKKKLRNRFYSVFYIINCLSSFWAHHAKTNNDIILFLNDPLGSKPFNNTSIVGECNVLLVDCVLATLVLCKLILLALVTFFRGAKINVFSCPKNKHLLFSKLTKIGVNFISSNHLRLLLLKLFTYSSTLNYNSPLTHYGLSHRWTFG